MGKEFLIVLFGGNHKRNLHGIIELSVKQKRLVIIDLTTMAQSYHKVSNGGVNKLTVSTCQG